MLAAFSGWFREFTSWVHARAQDEIWLQNVILVISAAVAILTIGITSVLERRRATVDLVRDQQKDEGLIKARKTVRSLLDASGKIDFDPILAQKDSEQLNAILSVLNSFEFMAAGLHTKAFDEKTYKRLLFNTVVDQWSLFEDFVYKYRENCKKEYTEAKGLNPDTQYQDFETLARKWSRDPLKRIRTSWNPFRKRPVPLVAQPPAPPRPPVQTQAPASPQPIVPTQPQTPPSDRASD